MITSPTGIAGRRIGGNGGRRAPTAAGRGSLDPGQELPPRARAELQDGAVPVRLGVADPDDGARPCGGPRGGQFDTAIAIAAVTGLTPAGKLLVAHDGSLGFLFRRGC